MPSEQAPYGEAVGDHLQGTYERCLSSVAVPEVTNAAGLQPRAGASHR